MLFGQHAIDKTVDEHLRDIAALASDQQTLIVLDTNILTYLYKLHEAAREDFFQWSDAVAAANRLAIPAWAASEYLSGVTSKTLDAYVPKAKEAGQPRKLLDGLLETAALFVDDASLRSIDFEGDRAAFLTGFRSAINALTPFTRVFSQAFDPGLIHRQIEQHLSSAILDSELAALCVRATTEGPGRFEHRLPPGFRDGSKPENRLGDLIIWFEVLEKAATSRAELPQVLFISRDEKDDWVYAPKMRVELVKGERRKVGNTRPEIKLADPRLIAEFRRKTGHSNFTIASLATLVEGLSRTDPAVFARLAAAIQVNIEQAAPVPESAAETVAPADESQQPLPHPLSAEVVLEVAAGPQVSAAPDPIELPINEPPVAVPLPRLLYPREALCDQEYQADAPGEINEIIRALKSHNWYTQNPAILLIPKLREIGNVEASSWFVLGRNIYQAACGNSQKAMDFMSALETQLRRFSNDTSQHLLAGMLFEVYFNAQGEFRSDVKFSYADRLLSMVTEADFADALAFIRYHLRSYSGCLIFLPGDTARKTIRIEVALAESVELAASPAVNAPTTPSATEVRSIILDNVELLRDVIDEQSNAWHRLLTRRRLSPERIRDRISNELAIPKWALVLETQPHIQSNVDLALPDHKEFEPKLALAG